MVQLNSRGDIFEKRSGFRGIYMDFFATVRFGLFTFRWAIYFLHIYEKLRTASVGTISIIQGAMQFVSIQFYLFMVKANSGQ